MVVALGIRRCGGAVAQSADSREGLSVAASSDRSQVIRFGVFEVERRSRELRKQGVRLRLQDQPFQVLAFLLERAGEPVTREELHQKLWPSSVYVDFDHGLNNAIARVREVLGDSATKPRFIETLPRLGYRFIYPVENALASSGVTTDESAERVAARPAADSLAVSRWSRPLLIATASVTLGIVVLGLFFGLWIAQRPPLGDARATPPLPKEPSVAVLPFANLSSDPENDYVAKGLSEELINALAGISDLKVVGRTSSFAFKDTQESAAVIAQQLNVNHLLEGSVRGSEQRLRITAQLIDAASGYHLWSEVFDRDVADILQIQEEIARSVASALEVELLAADHQRLSKRLTSDPEAYRLYLIARAQISWVFGRPDWAVVRRSYEEAIERDPEFAAAHAGLAHFFFNFGSSDEEIRLGRAAAERAVALDPGLSEALGARANWEVYTYLVEGDYEAYKRALQDFRRAFELDASNALVLFHYARAVVWSDPDLALSLFEETARLDPVRLSAVGFSASLMSSRLGQHEAARQRIRGLYDQNPDKRFHIAIHVAVLELYLGRLDEAVIFLRESLEQGNRGSPTRLWGLHMSLGDRETALRVLDTPDMQHLREAARFAMDGRYDEGFASLDRRRAESPERRLDVNAARLALIAGQPGPALEILESRLPALAAGVEPIDTRNVLPAIDLVAARLWTGDESSADELLQRVVAFLDGPSAPRWPMYVFLRARVHALAGELVSAQQALDRAYQEGFRTTWAIDAVPRSFDYIDSIDADPAFAALRTSPRYQSWLKRIKADNAQQLARLREREAGQPPRVAEIEKHNE